MKDYIKRFREKFVEGKYIADYIDGRAVLAQDLEAFLTEELERARREDLQEIFNISCDLPENYTLGESGKLSAINNLIMKKLADLTHSVEEKV